MNGELTRQYELPIPLSSETTTLVKHYKEVLANNTQNNSNAIQQLQDTIPDADDLLKIKADLEKLLSKSESRVKTFKKDLIVLDKLVHSREGDSIATSGKNVNALKGKMHIKQELDDTLDTVHSSSNIPKSELSRQAALEAIRRRRRKDEAEGYNTEGSEHHTIVRLKKLDGVPPLRASSSSPPPKKIKKSSSPNQSQYQQKMQKAAETDEVDFVRVKPKDQVPLATFWSSMESYFRNLTEQDREFLLQKSDQGKPYLIPPLGPYYLDTWAEEDQSVGFMVSKSTSTPTPPPSSQPQLKYLKQPLTDQQLLKDDISCGTLTERLIASLVQENVLDGEPLDQQDDEEEVEENDDDIVIDKKYNAKTVIQMSADPGHEVVEFEERLKRELRYAGLFGDEDIDWNAREDDEICAELRTLGRELKEQVQTNDSRKKKLLEVVDCQLQFEQYRQVLDTLDSQVEQGYLKRFRPQKSKKRKANGPKSVLSENAVYAMEKRKTWTQALGDIFKDKNMTMPKQSIFEDSATNNNN